jgi:amino acid transporter
MGGGGGGFTANKRHLLALALISVLNNGTSKWQYGLRAGLGYEIIFNFLSAVACFIYYCCASELTSAFPFPGGCFGFARCTVGFYPAFLIGCTEIFYYVASLIIITSNIALQIYFAYPDMKQWRYLIIFLLYIVQFGLCLSKRVFYRVATVLAVYGIVINVIYILGSCKELNFYKWAYRVDTSGKYWNDDVIGTLPPIADDDGAYNVSSFNAADVDRSDAMFNGHSPMVVQLIGHVLSVYMQIEYANLAVDDVKDPRRDVPFAMLIAGGIQFIFGTLNPIIASMMSPGLEAVSKLVWPMVPGKFVRHWFVSFKYNCAHLSPGLARIFGITNHQAVVLMVPIYFARVMATTYALGKLTSSMASSNLLPRGLSRKLWAEESPVQALTVATSVSLVLTLACQWFILGSADTYAGEGISIVLLCGLITYAIQLFGFMILRLKLSTIPSSFRSPFGVVGAVYSFVAFLVGMASALYVPPSQRSHIITGTVVILIVPSLYYFLYARHVQTFSESEKAILLLAHAEIKNANGKVCHVSIFAVVMVWCCVLLRVFVPAVPFNRGDS